MRLGKLGTALREGRARTDPRHPDPRLRGRTYAIPFSRVWRAVLQLAGPERSGYSISEADEDRGILRGECPRRLSRTVDQIELRVSLDENGLTRVDMSSVSRPEKADLGRNARRVGRFFRDLDRRLEAAPGQILDMTGELLPIGLLLLALVAGCGPGESPPAGEMAGEVESPGETRNFRGRRYERNMVFLAYRGDSTLLVPMFFSARTRADSVDRTTRGWLARGSSWDSFLSEAWAGPPSAAPWRVIPRGPVKLVVGMGDALETVIFREGGRNLEMSLGDLLIQWTGRRAQSFRVHEGALLLSEQEVEGQVLDMTRAWTADDPPPGDWGFLVSGDSVQIVLENTDPDAAPQGGSYTVRARIRFLDRQWEGVRLVWADARPYEAARRDVPWSWDIRSSGGDLAGSLETSSSVLQAGEGSGPLLPVEALFEVSGTLTLVGRDYPVRGLIRHLQH